MTWIVCFGYGSPTMTPTKRLISMMIQYDDRRLQLPVCPKKKKLTMDGNGRTDETRVLTVNEIMLW